MPRTARREADGGRPSAARSPGYRRLSSGTGSLRWPTTLGWRSLPSGPLTPPGGVLSIGWRLFNCSTHDRLSLVTTQRRWLSADAGSPSGPGDGGRTLDAHQAMGYEPLCVPPPEGP